LPQDTTTSEILFNNVAPITIPTQLAEFKGARFITISKKDANRKKPKEKDWTTTTNYAYGHPKLMGHIRSGGNYGIATGFGGLHCFDADEFDRLVELGIVAKLPVTLTSITGSAGTYGESRGRHYWFKIIGMSKRIVGYDPELHDSEKPDEFLHLLDIQSQGNYAIGPNSIHKTGRVYEVLVDEPIAEIQYDEMLKIISCLRLHKKNDLKKQQREIILRKSDKAAYREVSIEDIAMPTGTVKKNGSEIKGAHPIHGSKHGENFSINTAKGLWHCFRHDTGGSWPEFLAVKMGLISCGQAGTGCLSSSDRRKVMDYAEQCGLIESEPIVDAPVAEIHMNLELVDEIPTEIPDGDVVVIRAPPRTGKSHAAALWLKRAGSGNYITHNHAIVEHEIKIARDICMQRVVWLVGIGQPGACRQTSDIGNCSKCTLAHTPENHFEMERNATALLRSKGILTAKDVPAHMCPYYMLKMAEPHANYCFTVVNNIEKIRHRELVILDEEPVLGHFYPTTIEVATIKNRAGDSASKNYLVKSEWLQRELRSIMKDGKKPAMKQYAEKIIEISGIIDAGIEAGDFIEDIAEEIDDALLGFTPKHHEVEEDGNQDEGDELTFDQCVKCLGHLYTENPVHIERKRGGYHSIYILGDENKTQYNMDWFGETSKVILIGATRAVLFAREFNGREIEVRSFRYDDRFTLLGVESDDISTKKSSATGQKKKIIDIINGGWKNSEKTDRSPCMILTGSKKEQTIVAGLVKGAMLIKTEREEGMKWAHSSGAPMIFYQGSVVSRGQDVEQCNVMFVYGCNFSQPFWSVADKNIAAAIISDETTNSVLRISSTLRSDNKCMKIVVMPKNDMGKVKDEYVKDRRVLSQNGAAIARILKNLGVAGKVSRGNNGEIKLTSAGINYESGKGKLLELISNIEESHDDEEVATQMGLIRAFMTKAMRTHKNGITTDAIMTGIGKIKNYKLTREALIRMRYGGELAEEKRGKKTMWKSKTKT
jgi:hypothetical protein